jgi:hypothetical protein
LEKSGAQKASVPFPQVTVTVELNADPV